MRYLTPLILLACCLSLLAPSFAVAVVEIGRAGGDAVLIDEVYHRQGTSFVAIDEVLAALELEGEWDAVAHVYRIDTGRGRAVISPGSQFLKLGDDFIPIAHRPRFIDGKLRVSEAFLLRQLAPLLDTPLHYRNRDPSVARDAEEDPLDRLFAFLLRRKPQTADPSQWTVALDPGHGGTDSGVIGPDGSKEKVITLAVAEKVERLLKMHQDAPVLMTRDDDYAVDADHRLQAVARAEADVLLSLHAQGFFASEPHGITLFIQPETARDVPEGMAGENASLRLAVALGEALSAAGFTLGGIVEQPVLPLGRGDLPRVLVEMGALSHAGDLALLRDPVRQQDLARALFDGLQTFFHEQKDLSYDAPASLAQ